MKKPLRKMGPDSPLGSPGTGYTIDGDKIKLAPLLTDKIEKIMADDRGLREFERRFMEFFTDAHIQLTNRTKAWWDDVKYNLGTDWGEGKWAYDSLNESIIRQPPEPKKEPTP